MGTMLVLSSLVAVCGFIAYTGDLLGRRLGKKRLTIFGLRPRHTAILCTVITGMVIAVITLGVMMGVSAGVRRAVTDGEALVRQNQEYSTQRDALLREAARLTAEVGPLRRQNGELKQSNGALEAANHSLVEKNCTLTYSEQTLQKEKRDLQGANELAQQDLRATRAQRQAVKRELKLVRQQFQVTSASLGKSRRDLEGNRKLIQDNLRKLARLEVRLGNLRAQVDMLALGDVKVREGEELARVTVPAWATESETRALLQTLITRVRQVARERGARRKGPYLEAYLRNSRLAHMFGPTAEGVNVAERDLVQLLVEEVTGSEQDVVLLAQSVMNTAKSEPIAFDVNPYWNVLAFRKGEEIASATIDPTLSPGKILEQLATLLRTRVRKVAADRQMIPGPRNELGEVRYDPLLEVLDKVKRLGVPAKVGVVAAREVRNADPLEIDFYVVPAEKAVAAQATRVVDGER